VYQFSTSLCKKKPVEATGGKGNSVHQQVVFPEFSAEPLKTLAEGFEDGVGDAGVPGERAPDFEPVEGFCTEAFGGVKVAGAVFVVLGEFEAGGEIAGEFVEHTFEGLLHVEPSLAAFTGEGDHFEAFAAQGGPFFGFEKCAAMSNDVVVVFLTEMEANEGKPVFDVLEAASLGLGKALR
jgi:hypothetical protein